jgi:signal transduction histidine kinase
VALVGPHVLQDLLNINQLAKGLLALVNDLLDIAKIEKHEMVLDSAPLDVRAVVHAALVSVQPQADAKGLAIVTEFDSSVRLCRQSPRTSSSPADPFSVRAGVHR